MDYPTEQIMHVSDLAAELETIRVNHGNLPLFVYSDTEKRGMPLVRPGITLSYAFTKPVFGQQEHASAATLSAAIKWVEDGNLVRLAAEAARLRAEQAEINASLREHMILLDSEDIVERVVFALDHLEEYANKLSDIRLGLLEPQDA